MEILVGKKNLEVRPMSINKGEIVKRILTQHADADMVVCAGDDKTDEDMFRMLNAAYYASQQAPVSPETRPPPHTRSGRSTSSPPSTWSEMDMALFSITVGPPEKKTKANWHVRSSTDVVDCLKKLAKCHAT